MKHVILLLLQALFIFHGFSNKLLTKFHQNGFKIKDFRAELSMYNKSYFNLAEIKTFKYNRTTAVVNATFNLKIAIDDRLEILVQAYKFMSNEYRHFPIRFQVNAKKFFDSNAVGIRRITNCGNVVDVIFEKNVTYRVCNIVPDESRFPPLLPNGKFRFNALILYLNDEVSTIFAFLEIYTPIQYPKK